MFSFDLVIKLICLIVFSDPNAPPAASQSAPPPPTSQQQQDQEEPSQPPALPFWDTYDTINQLYLEISNARFNFMCLFRSKIN